ncbi:MAG: DUF2183 domain-containing protein [Mycolicibacterium aromaticivorans]|nr:DUF2183 domain-containing protein [Mycolicibacterium aromaticivorans]
MPRLPRRITSDLTAVVAGLEGKLTERRRDLKVQLGAFRGVHVVVYRGYVADDIAKVRVRVMETPELPGDSRIPYIVGTEVELRIGKHRATEVTDSRGFANFSLPVPTLRVGWHTAEAVAAGISDDEPAVGTGWVMKPSLAAPYLVISDIDDTILLTGLTEGVAMVARTLLHAVEQRSAIPGMSAFYRGLARGVESRTGSRRAEPTFFYVSTGSWSFYSMLEQFVELRAFQPGPMFLTDWGPTERYLRRSGAEHKRAAVRRLFEAYPRMRFVVIGDSGQRDPLIYEEVAREFPGRVLAAIIRQVGADDDERNVSLREHAQTLRDEGIPMHLVADAGQAAELARSLRLCDEDTVAEARAELNN